MNKALNTASVLHKSAFTTYYPFDRATDNIAEVLDFVINAGVHDDDQQHLLPIDTTEDNRGALNVADLLVLAHSTFAGQMSSEEISLRESKINQFLSEIFVGQNVTAFLKPKTTTSSKEVRFTFDNLLQLETRLDFFGSKLVTEIKSRQLKADLTADIEHYANTGVHRGHVEHYTSRSQF